MKGLRQWIIEVLHAKWPWWLQFLGLILVMVWLVWLMDASCACDKWELPRQLGGFRSVADYAAKVHENFGDNAGLGP